MTDQPPPAPAPKPNKALLWGGLGAAGCLAFIALVAVCLVAYLVMSAHSGTPSPADPGSPAAVPAGRVGDRPPTAQEVMAALSKAREESWMGSYAWPTSRVETAVTDIRIGGKIRKEVGYGESAREVWTVKAKVASKVYLKNGTVKDEVQELKSNEAYFFYPDAFGAWAFKWGSM